MSAAMPPNVGAVNLPLRFMVTGVLAFLGGVICLVLRPDILATYHYNQYVIATTHLFVLGWISTIVMGAMYQLVPVALETRLYSDRLARWQFVLHVVGFTGMVWMFWKWDMKQVGHFGCVLATGVGLFVYNIFRTLLRVPRWNTVAAAVASALVWLSLTITAGLMIATGKCTYESTMTGVMGGLVESLRSIAFVAARFDQIAAMHAHAHLGAIGVFIMMIVGVSYKLIPMFTLSEVQSRRRAGASVLLLNVGLAGAFVGILLRSPFKILFTACAVAGLVVYAVEMRAILRARKRQNLDLALKYFITALFCLVPVCMLGLVLSWPGLPLTTFTGQLENWYGFLGLIGVVSFAIIGMLYKIVPFLIWYTSYSPHIGKQKLPALADLFNARVQKFGYWTFMAALLVASAGIVMGHAGLSRAGAIILGLSAAALNLNLGIMLSHLYRPRLAPAPAPPAKPGMKTLQPAAL